MSPSLGAARAAAPRLALAARPRRRLSFTLAWNDYIFTRILIASDELKTLPVGVQDLFSAAVVDWGLVMAAGVLITLPALAFFMAVQRHLVEGWGSGGLRG